MAVNKVILGDETLVDLTSDTATPETVLAGATFHTASGEEATGTAVIPTKVTDLEDGADYLKITDAQETYQTKLTADTDYLTPDTAADTYQTKLTADTDYLTPATAADTYQPKGTYVKTVNNTAPDENGNVTVEGGGGTSAVTSVNGYTGEVKLTPEDVGAATAAQGALADTALQSVPDTYRTAAEQDEIHDSTKQDVLTAGTGISIKTDSDGTKISTNLQAGMGISISGNVISGSSLVLLWDGGTDGQLWGGNTFTLTDDRTNYKFLIVVSSTGLVYPFPVTAIYFSFMPMSVNTSRIYFAKGSIAWGDDNRTFTPTYGLRAYTGGTSIVTNSEVDMLVSYIYGVI